MKNIVELAIDAAEAAVVLGARALCVFAAIGESTTQNVHVDNLYDEQRRWLAGRPVDACDICGITGCTYAERHPGTAPEVDPADCVTPETTAEASPEADAGQPLASAATLTADDLESAAFACRKQADASIFEGGQLYWNDVAYRLNSLRDSGIAMSALNHFLAKK